MKLLFVFSIATAIVFVLGARAAFADNGWKCTNSSVADCFATEALCNASACPRNAGCETATCTPNIKGWKCTGSTVYTQCYADETCGGSCNTSCNPDSCNPSTGTTQSVTVNLPNPLGSTSDIPGVIEQIVRFLRDIAVPIVAGMVIYGAFQILTAGGDPEKFATGRRTILYAVIGYAIIWIGWGISDLIKNILSGS